MGSRQWIRDQAGNRTPDIGPSKARRPGAIQWRCPAATVTRAADRCAGRSELPGGLLEEGSGPHFPGGEGGEGFRPSSASPRRRAQDRRTAREHDTLRQLRAQHEQHVLRSDDDVQRRAHHCARGRVERNARRAPRGRQLHRRGLRGHRAARSRPGSRQGRSRQGPSYVASVKRLSFRFMSSPRVRRQDNRGAGSGTDTARQASQVALPLFSDISARAFATGTVFGKSHPRVSR